jgi:3-phenylpropionate/trans-cinnamate dioxygenase ferredoxin reductase component
MQHYSYLIVGGGMTAAAAAKGIREIDPHGGTIGLIGAESQPPYKRPPLSKGLWKTTPPPLAKTAINLQDLDVQLMLGRNVQVLDTAHQRVTDDQGDVYTFDKLLLATGGVPRRLADSNPNVIYYRTLADFHQLHALAERGQRFAVIGGGFIGSEIAAALTMNQKHVTMLFPGSGIGAAVFAPDLSQFLNDYYRQRGVEVLSSTRVVAVEQHGEQLQVRTDGNHELIVDGVVAGLGIAPNTTLAQAAGLAVDDGIVVDRLLRTSHPMIYAAGDVARFHNPLLERQLRVEHEDNANMMGRQAGRNMAGQAEPYDYLPFFYSDLFDLGYEAVGDLDARLELFADWKEPFREGVIYYLKDGRVRGVMLWNVWGQVDAARDLIAAPGPFQAGDLIGRLPA